MYGSVGVSVEILLYVYNFYVYHLYHMFAFYMSRGYLSCVLFIFYVGTYIKFLFSTVCKTST